MSAELSRGPAWVMAEPPGFASENPLAVSRHVTTQSRKLATVATSTTAHARYYTLHGLVAAEASAREFDREQQVDLLRRCEVVLGGISAAHGAEQHPTMRRIHGINAISASLERQGSLNLSGLAGDGAGSYTKRRWGFAWLYATAEQSLGLVSWGPNGIGAGRNLDIPAVREGLGEILTLARQEHVDLQELRSHSALCICQMPTAADGAALRERLLALDADPDSRDGRSGQTVRLVHALLDVNGGASGDLQRELGDVLLFEPTAQRDPRIAALTVTPAWQGLFLRDISVRAWHELWSWLLDPIRIDGGIPVDELAGRLINELPEGTLNAYLSVLPPRLAGDTETAFIRRAERDVETEARSAPDTNLAKLLLGAQRVGELPERVAAYFEDPTTEGRTRLRPSWLRAVASEWGDRPLHDFAVFLVEQMVSRAQHIALAKARFNSTTWQYEPPNGIFVRDGVVTADRPQTSFNVWFRWSAIARILSGVGLTEHIDGGWRASNGGHPQ